MNHQQKTEKSSGRPKKWKRAISLRAYLIWVLLLFLAVALFVTWLFQIVLLDAVYEYVRLRDMKKAAVQIAENINDASVEATAYDVATDGLMSVLIYRIDGEHATEVATETVGSENASFIITPERMSDLYLKARNCGGKYHTKVTFGGHEVEYSFLQSLLPAFFGESGALITPKMMNLVYVQLCEDQAGNEYVILLNSSLSPLTPMVHTLQRQFFWIFIILFSLVVLLSIPVSKRISRPIVRMNEAAKQLANGNYDADFSDVHGYKETRELGESLNFAAQELSRTDQLQKELIANISHDLRTPLTMIRGYGEAMRDIPGENTPENVQVLIDEAEHLSELVNDLLDLSKIRSGVRCPVMEFFDLTTAIREVMERYEAFTKAQGYRICLQVEGTAPVFADRGMILQVIYNLINNAINYTGEDLTVTVCQKTDQNRVRIEVIDTGEGIDPDQIPLIWDRYYKVDKVHRMARIGTGLGLSIVKGILEVHNAAYGVESARGAGSVFWFELPISEPPEDAMDHPTMREREASMTL